MSDMINAKIDRTLAEQVLDLAKEKYPFRFTKDNYTKAIREACIEFVKKTKIEQETKTGE